MHPADDGHAIGVVQEQSCLQMFVKQRTGRAFCALVALFNHHIALNGNVVGGELQPGHTICFHLHHQI